MAEIRGVKRLGPKPKFAPIKAKPDAGRPVAFFEDVHVKEGTINDRLYFGRDPARDQHLHHRKAARRRAPDTPKRVHTAWTDEEDLQIRIMVKANHTVQEIANELGRSLYSTQKRISRLRKEYDLPYSTRNGRHK